MEIDHASIGPEFVRVMKEEGLTRADIANIANVSPQAVYKWAYGITAPELSHVLLVSKETKVPLSKMFKQLLV